MSVAMISNVDSVNNIPPDANLTTQTRSFSTEGDKSGHSTTLTFSFPHKVVGIIGGSTAWNPGGPSSISGNSVTYIYYTGHASTVTVTAIGY